MKCLWSYQIAMLLESDVLTCVVHQREIIAFDVYLNSMTATSQGALAFQVLAIVIGERVRDLSLYLDALP